MPIYEYHCKQCNEYFDVEQRMTDDALSIHDDCGGNLEKVFSSAGIVFKGSGFHKTDSRSSSSKKSSPTSTNDSKTASTDKTTADKTVDKKPDQSTSTKEKPTTKPSDTKK